MLSQVRRRIPKVGPLRDTSFIDICSVSGYPTMSQVRQISANVNSTGYFHKFEMSNIHRAQSLSSSSSLLKNLTSLQWVKIFQ